MRISGPAQVRLAAIEVAHKVADGNGELLALLTTYSIALYFLAGILFRAALQANAALVVTFGVALTALGQPAGRIVYLDGLLAATAIIGGVAFRHQGIRFRRTFLERGLIAEMAARDGLTGLHNRRALDEHLVRVWQQGLRDRRSLAVLMIDVDHFKRFNDHYGHQAGDDALRRIATVVKGFAQRPLDIAARYGGEELVLVLFDASRNHVTQIAERARLAVQNLGIGHIAGEKVITISIGVAVVHPTLERSPSGALQLADEALYEAKRAGRNQINIFESEYQTLTTGSFRQRQG